MTTVIEEDRALIEALSRPMARTALEAKALDYIRDGRGDDSEAVLLAAAHRELGERRADAAVVGWLRGPFVPDHSDEGGCPFDKAAKMLERGDHRSKP